MNTTVQATFTAGVFPSGVHWVDGASGTLHLLRAGNYLSKLSGAVISLRSSNGQELRTYTDADGFFSFSNVPAGSHIVNPFILGLMYPEVCDISSTHTLILFCNMMSSGE